MSNIIKTHQITYVQNLYKYLRILRDVWGLHGLCLQSLLQLWRTCSKAGPSSAAGPIK